MNTKQALALHNQLLALQAGYRALVRTERDHADTLAEMAEQMATTFESPAEFSANIGKRMLYTDRAGYLAWKKSQMISGLDAEESLTCLGVIDSVWAWGYTVAIDTRAIKATIGFTLVGKFFQIED